METQPTKIEGDKYQVSIHLDSKYKIVGLPNVSMLGVIMEWSVWAGMNPIVSKGYNVIHFNSYQDALNFYNQNLVKK